MVMVKTRRFDIPVVVFAINVIIPIEITVLILLRVKVVDFLAVGKTFGGR